jgi:hypothetical protein
MLRLHMYVTSKVPKRSDPDINTITIQVFKFYLLSRQIDIKP